MARRSRAGWLWAAGAGAAVLGLGGVAFAVSRRRADELPGGSTGSGAGSGKPADPRAADAAFTATTAAAATAAVASWPATAPYVGAATPLGGAAWQGQPAAQRAGIFDPSTATAAQIAAGAAAGAAPAGETKEQYYARTGKLREDDWGGATAGLAGWAFGAPPKFAKKGPGAVFKWSVDRFVKELKKALKNLGAQFCKNADKVYKKLADAGAAVPKQSKWDDLSCDQKIAFVAALGPQGVLMLASGALAAGFARDAAAEFKKFGGKASAAVADLSKKLGVKVPKLNVGGTAGDVVKKASSLFGLDDCVGCGGGRGEPLPGANLPGTSFVTPAGVPARPHPANFRTRDVSPVKLGIL